MHLKRKFKVTDSSRQEHQVSSEVKRGLHSLLGCHSLYWGFCGEGKAGQREQFRTG